MRASVEKVDVLGWNKSYVGACDGPLHPRLPSMVSYCSPVTDPCVLQGVGQGCVGPTADTGSESLP